jgi:adenosylcobinamide hydrolase
MSDADSDSETETTTVFETTVRDGVCQLRRPESRWLSSGWNGGVSTGPAAYNVTVPEGWPETDLRAYVDSRRAAAGFDTSGPTLLTGVSQRHARRARLDRVEAVATAGVSNPAALPIAADGDRVPSDDASAGTSVGSAGVNADRHDTPPGTVNLFVGTTASLAPGALANLLTVAAEAKAATLLSVAGVPGTTTDAVVAACDPTGPRERFSGSATSVGRAARACVRDAVLASLDSRYADEPLPTVETAEYGVVTDARAEVTRL